MDDPIKTVYEGKWLRLKRRGRWEFAERTNAGGMAVIIIAVTPDGNLVFVEQERIPVEGKTIEMPAGLVGDIDGAESIELAASRELLEETGWQAGRVELLMSGPTSSGMSNERVAFVRARDLVRVHAVAGFNAVHIPSLVAGVIPLRIAAAKQLCQVFVRRQDQSGVAVTADVVQGRADQVVGFVLRVGKNLKPERATNRLAIRELALELFGCRLPVGLVRRVKRVAEAAFESDIESEYEPLRLVPFDQFQHEAGEAVHRIHRLAIGVLEFVRHGVPGAEHVHA